jgi:hypothetical protein
MGETGNAYRILVEKLLGNVHMEGREGNSGDDIRMDLMEMIIYVGRW